MKAYVVVEGPADVKLITCLLPQEIQRQVAVVSASGRSNLTSVARTILVTRRKPLVILRDADNIDQSSTEHLRSETEEFVRAVSVGIPFKVFLIVPEIEALLFTVPAALERLTGQQLSPGDLALAKFRPKQVIMKLGLSNTSGIEQIVKGLTEQERNEIREVSPIKEMIDFLSEVTLAMPQLA